ncbi:hypothetical protein LTR81_015523 [Elasticomyces elasticus]
MAKKSPLLQLPSELRNRIYTLTLSSAEPVIISLSTGLPKPSLLKVCRSVTAETTQLYYACNTFNVHLAPTTSMTFAGWFCALSRNSCQAIRAIVLEVDEWMAEAGIAYWYKGPESPPACVVREDWGLFCRAIVKAGIPANRVRVEGWVRPGSMHAGFWKLASDWVINFEEQMKEALLAASKKTDGCDLDGSSGGGRGVERRHRDSYACCDRNSSFTARWTDHATQGKAKVKSANPEPPHRPPSTVYHTRITLLFRCSPPSSEGLASVLHNFEDPGPLLCGRARNTQLHHNICLQHHDHSYSTPTHHSIRTSDQALRYALRGAHSNDTPPQTAQTAISKKANPSPNRNPCRPPTHALPPLIHPSSIPEYAPARKAAASNVIDPTQTRKRSLPAPKTAKASKRPQGSKVGSEVNSLPLPGQPGFDEYFTYMYDVHKDE